MPELLLQIDLPYACAGIVVKDGFVIEAAPIFKWMIGKSFEYISFWVHTKGGKIRMTYHDLSECTLSPEERKAEADRIIEILSEEYDYTPKEEEFIAQMVDSETVSVKQLFWLRDIKEKYT